MNLLNILLKYHNYKIIIDLIYQIKRKKKFFRYA